MPSYDEVKAEISDLLEELKASENDRWWDQWTERFPEANVMIGLKASSSDDAPIIFVNYGDDDENTIYSPLWEHVELWCDGVEAPREWFEKMAVEFEKMAAELRKAKHAF